MQETNVRLRLRTQALVQDALGYNQWQASEAEQCWAWSQTALLLCDVWDAHWCRGARERLDAMIPRMNALTGALRERGATIIHAPSETMPFYAGTPARERALATPRVVPPPPSPHPDPPLPIDDSDGGADTGETPWHRAWSRQHAGIEIDHSRDLISDDGAEVYSIVQQRGIAHLLVAGVHTNMCVLHRSFGIKQMVRWGVDVVLVRDLTDTMYNPASRPYVSHAAGTQLVVSYIEQFWCPTVDSADLLS